MSRQLLFILTNILLILTGFVACVEMDFNRIEFSEITVVTTGVENSRTKATVSGRIVVTKLNKSDEVMDRGIVWSTEHDMPVITKDPFAGDLINIANDEFSKDIESLDPGSRYYARTYVSVLDSVIYGETVSFIVHWQRLDGQVNTPEARSNATVVQKGNEVRLFFGDNDTRIFKDSWLFTSGIWSQVGFAYTGDLRTSAVGFAIDDQIYFGLGADNSGELLDDFWVFNPATGAVAEDATFPVKSEGAISFTIGSKGYAGMGKSFSTFFSQLYELVPSGDWQAVSYQGSTFPTGRAEAVVFTIGNIAYIGLGRTADGMQDDFYAFDPADNSWEKLPSFPPGGRSGAIGFTIGNKGYVGMGLSNNGLESDMWEFDPNRPDPWKLIANNPEAARLNMAVFTVDNKKALIGLGNKDNIYLDDWWEFTPGD